MTSVDMQEAADHLEPNNMLAVFAYEKYAIGFAALFNAHVARSYIFKELTRPYTPLCLEDAAVSLMYHGAQDMIRAQFSYEDSVNLAKLRTRYEEAVPGLQRVIHRVYQEDEAYMGLLSPVLVRDQPSPMTVQSTYVALCNSQRCRLDALTLADRIEMPDTPYWRVRRRSSRFSY